MRHAIGFVLSLALLHAAAPAYGQSTASGKSTAVLDGDFDPSGGCLVAVPVGTIPKGKKNALLTVQVTASKLKNNSVARIFAPKVNDHSMNGPDSIDAPAQSTYDNGAVSGVWWLDLSATEENYPGLLLGKPLVITIDQLCFASGSGAFHVTAVARMTKK